MYKDLLPKLLITALVLLTAFVGYQKIQIDHLERELQTSQQELQAQIDLTHQAQAEAAIQRELAIKVHERAEQLRLQAELALKGN